MKVHKAQVWKRVERNIPQRLLEVQLILETPQDEAQATTLLKAIAANRTDILIEIGAPK
jgi:hypothetical protein